jgi:tetratricopeptide (TPR) repeat protein
VDTIIARHIDARGGEAALRAIQSLVFDHGVYREPGYEGDGGAVMMLMRPYYKLVGHPERNPGFLEGYDGAAWEWYPDPGLVVRTTGAPSAAIRHYADVEGPFLDFASKGSRAELIAEARIGDRRTYQVRLTMMDGFETDFFIDRRTYMIVASRHTAPVHAFGAAVTSETRFDDFRRVGGVLFPFRSAEVEIATGRELNAMQWGSIEANREIPVAWFSPPDISRTPLQTLMDQLYMQRMDANAMLWTYHMFRRAHPGVDTREALEVIGFQALKTGQVEQAIALLERNARDNPNAADSAFGLGRAYATAGRTADARRELQRALQLEPGHARATRALEALPQD